MSKQGEEKNCHLLLFEQRHPLVMANLNYRTQWISSSLSSQHFYFFKAAAK